ncbi:RecB family exonuclease [Actinomycetospora corticicola]|uniref:Putative RecB family exonuclease n=1 Tax=Actinomycetospora corticicola TaxID=663602 RepID=A0A7Y9J529_9PSEU|nr:PD-(D/E)XK nuclease family protein [Actinomycetospora corticicola]NYD35541.1 putative RecB family exonuclease [Actinomycetospora corticicola]
MIETTTSPTVPAPRTSPEDRPRRRPALSPSRAGDFKQCPLLYRFRAVDRLPERRSPAQLRGIVVHAVLERLFGLDPPLRRPARAHALLAEVVAELDGDDRALLGDPAAAAALVDAYFAMEDPRRLRPEACEVYLETELASGVGLRGYVDRLDVSPEGDVRIVDYKTGAAPREVFEARALFQLKFYALVLLRARGVLPRQLRLMYLADGQSLTHAPTVPELERFERTVVALWAAILRAAPTGDFRPNPGRACSWCSHQAVCPAFGGTPPDYPGWPGESRDVRPDETVETAPP